MNEKFGQFDWKRWKDEKPDKDRYIYIYGFNLVDDVVIAKGGEYEFDYYWCYVYMPDPPKIEKKMSLEDRIERLEKMFDDYIKSRPIMVGAGNLQYDSIRLI